MTAPENRPASAPAPGLIAPRRSLPATAADTSASPEQARGELVALILVAAVANLNLSVANVALPAIGSAFDAAQTTLDLIAVGYSLGLASSVLWLGAIGDRYGRKLMLVLGTRSRSRPPARRVRAQRRRSRPGAALGGVAAGMAYPTTLALITALWSGPARTRRSRCGPVSAARSRHSGP